MINSLVFDLEHNRKRLQYYSQLKQKSVSKKAGAIDKWVAIYEERVQKLERKANKLGLKFQLQASSASDARSA